MKMSKHYTVLLLGAAMFCAFGLAGPSPPSNQTSIVTKSSVIKYIPHAVTVSQAPSQALMKQSFYAGRTTRSTERIARYVPVTIGKTISTPRRPLKSPGWCS